MYHEQTTLSDTSSRKLIDTVHRFRQLAIYANAENAGTIYLGDADGQTYPIEPGGRFSLDSVEPAKIYIKGTVADTLTVIGTII